MENRKIKILMNAPEFQGVGHYRSIWPAQEMQRKFSDKFDLKIDLNPNFNDLDSLKKYDIIHFHRQFGPYEQMDHIFDELKKAGVILIMDIDDYWSPPSTHPMYFMIKEHEIEKKITDTLRKVDYVSTTTELFAKEIRKYNKNVFVIPNAVDINHKMWKQIETEKTDKLRVSWIGGSSHLKDLEILKPSMNLLNNDSDLKDKFQVILCGFDIRGHVTEVNPETNERRTRHILPHETVWNKFENIFTSEFKNIDPEYKSFLHSYKNEPYKLKKDTELNYVRRWTLPLTQYGKHYSYCDVCLAPLEKSTFNEVKSELKIIEAGMTKKIIIAQDFGIYKELIKQGENGFLVKDIRNHKDWYKTIKHLIENKSEVERISNNLHEFVKDKYSLENVTKDRVDIYENLFKKKMAEIC